MLKICVSHCIFFNSNYSKSLKKTFLNSITTSNILKGYDVTHIVYYDDSVPEELISSLNQYKNVILIKKQTSVKFQAFFWRFECFNTHKEFFDIFIFRDIDLKFEENDIQIIETFVKSEREVYYSFARDPRQQYPKFGFILAGFFGIKSSVNFNFKDEINNFSNDNDISIYGKDEEFLALHFYKKYKCLVFYEPKIRKFLRKRPNYKHIGVEQDHEKYIRLDNNFKYFI
jgi:hypothetical protein